MKKRRRKLMNLFRILVRLKANLVRVCRSIGRKLRNLRLLLMSKGWKMRGIRTNVGILRERRGNLRLELEVWRFRSWLLEKLSSRKKSK